MIRLTLTLKMTTAQVVETLVTVNNNSRIRDYVHPEDQTQPTFQVMIIYRLINILSLQLSLRAILTRDFAPGACSRGTFREQSSSVCTNNFMGILHPREQASSQGKLSELENAPSCVLTRAKWAWSMLREQNPSCVSGFTVNIDYQNYWRILLWRKLLCDKQNC